MDELQEVRTMLEHRERENARLGEKLAQAEADNARLLAAEKRNEELFSALEDLQRSVGAVEERCRVAEAEVQRLHGSWSRRLTAPFRAVARSFRHSA